MKAKYLVYLLIISLALRIIMNVTMTLLAMNGEIYLGLRAFGFISGGINILVFVSIVGLLIKIFTYKNKGDFLNS